MMDRIAFNRRLNDLSSYTPQEKADIQTEKNRYPFCALLQMMDLLSDKATGALMWRERLMPKVSLYLFDHEHIESLISRAKLDEGQLPEEPTAKTAAKAPAKPTKHTEPRPESNGPFDIMQEINSYQEVSFKTAPKSVILSKFLETSNCQPEDFVTGSNASVEDLGKKSVREDDSLDTETLALVCEKQGKYERAISIYEKLIVKYPEKSSTFAIRITELKKQLENKK